MISFRRHVSVGVQFLLAIVLVSLLVGVVLDQPVLLSYVETGSMAPTMDPGDGFIAVPAALSGGIDSGDVIVFDAQEIEGGGLTTHRVVGSTEQGYITQGDANQFADQDGDEPPVQDAQIVATAVMVGDEVVVIPQLGTAVMSLQSGLDSVQQRLAVAFGVRWLQGTGGLTTILFGLSVVAFLLEWVVSDPDRRDRTRELHRDDGTSTRTVLIVCAGLVVLAATAAMVAPGGTHEYGVVSAQFESERPTVIQQGTSEQLPYPTANNGFVPVYTYLESNTDTVDVAADTEGAGHDSDTESQNAEAGTEGSNVEAGTEGSNVEVAASSTDGSSHVGPTYVAPRSEAELTVILHAPPETGYYPMYVQERRYLAVLPAAIVDDLYRIHPWLPILAINGLIGGGIVAIGLVLVRGRRRLRHRQRETPRSVTGRLREVLYE